MHLTYELPSVAKAWYGMYQKDKISMKITPVNLTTAVVYTFKGSLFSAFSTVWINLCYVMLNLCMFAGMIQMIKVENVLSHFPPPVIEYYGAFIKNEDIS